MTILEKCEAIKKKFASISPAERYNLIMEMGQKLPSYPEPFKTEENRVKGCQSILYLHADLVDGKLFFQADGDALISKGLAALLIAIYNGESPEEILSLSPIFLQEMGILASLSPSRSNGLSQLLAKIRKTAILHLKK